MKINPVFMYQFGYSLCGVFCWKLCVLSIIPRITVLTFFLKTGNFYESHCTSLFFT